MMKKLSLLILLTVIIVASSDAQRWKRYRHEAWGGIGASNFLGELGGGDSEAKDIVLDFDGKSSRYFLAGGYRYKLNEAINLRGSLGYGMLSGSDALSGDVHRRSRNLSFRTQLVEMTAQGEIYFIREKTSKRYKVRGIRGSLGSGISAYVMGGVGGMFFNPKAKFVGNAQYPGDNKWHALQPLGTEGQGILPGTKKYSRISMCFPVGIGARYTINRNISLTLEYNFRFTLTDYMDDVSTKYYDPAVLQAQSGDAAAWFSNPAIEVEKDDGTTFLAGGSTYDPNQRQQRGDPTTNDTYMYAILALNYKFTAKKSNRPKF